VTYLIPVFSTTAGVLLLGEHLTVANLIGAPLIIAGAATAQWPRGAQPPSAQPGPPDLSTPDLSTPGKRRVPS
jgi:drug/metabolite transporter (DMT)-like permease